MKKIKFQLTGIVPMLMHNGQGADPLSYFSKEIKKLSSKRVKSDEDYAGMAKLEYEAGLYLTNGGTPCIPGRVLEGVLFGKGGAARKEKMGKQAQAGLFCDDDIPLEYDGPKTFDEMWADETMRDVSPVKVQQNKVMRTRPKIPTGWTARGELVFNEKLIDRAQVVRWLEVAGEEIGLMDWRPRYGRFEVKILK